MREVRPVGGATGRFVPGHFHDNSDRERVRDAADIVRVVGEHVSLKARGREFVGLCPFHDDHKPSMNVVPAKGIFHCFVCGTGGDVFSFVQRFHKMEFREALTYLAERFGVELTPVGSRDGAAPQGPSRSDLYEANATSLKFFRTILGDAIHGKSGRDLIERRGIASEMVEQFQVGLAPDRWDGLCLRISQLRLDPQDFLDAGLIKTRDDGSGRYDTLRNRLIFPIHDQIGRVVAFGGRRVDDEDEPKYLNSPETRVFRKSATIYGLHHAAKSIQQTRIAIITEGYTDVIACHQGGFTNAVATLGTALTREHAAILRRLCDGVVLLFDGDEAGQRAADRAVEVFFAEPLDVKICTLNRFTDAKDPDELLKRPDGREVFERAIAASQDLLTFRFARLRERLNGAGVAALSRAIDEELARLAELGLADVPPVRQALIVRQVAGLAGLDEATIRRAIPMGRGKRTAMNAGPDAGEQARRLALTRLSRGTLSPGEHMLGCVLCDGALWSRLDELEHEWLSPGGFADALVSRLAGTAHDLGLAGDEPSLAHVLSATEDLDIKDAAIALRTRLEAETLGNAEQLLAHFEACRKRLRLDRASASPAGTEAELKPALEAHVKEQRRLHTEIGGDRRVLPKPRA